MLTMKAMVMIQSDLSGEFDYRKRVFQADVHTLACLFFILALEKTFRDAGIDPPGLRLTCWCTS